MFLVVLSAPINHKHQHYYAQFYRNVIARGHVRAHAALWNPVRDDRTGNFLLPVLVIIWPRSCFSRGKSAIGCKITTRKAERNRNCCAAAADGWPRAEKFGAIERQRSAVVLRAEREYQPFKGMRTHVRKHS